MENLSNQKWVTVSVSFKGKKMHDRIFMCEPGKTLLCKILFFLFYFLHKGDLKNQIERNLKEERSKDPNSSEKITISSFSFRDNVQKKTIYLIDNNVSFFTL